jgi:hypothetical protein
MRRYNFFVPQASSMLVALLTLGMVLGAISTALAQPQSTLGTFTTIDIPNATRTQARYLNPRGDIVGFYTAGTVHGFLQSKYAEPIPIDFPDADFTMALGVNPQGDIVGLYGLAGKQHGFLRTGDGMFFSMDFSPSAISTSAWGINARGDIVGAYTSDGKTHGYIRDKDGNFSSFDVPNASFTSPFAVNSEGDIVGQYGAGGTTHGFVRRQDGGFSSFDVPGSINTAIGTQTRGISERGDIVGWFMTQGGQRRGFLLSQDQFTFIDFPGAIGTDTDGINSEGEVVGGYDGVDGKHHGYVLTR